MTSSYRPQLREREPGNWAEFYASKPLPQGTVIVVYTNYRGETSERRIVPKKIWYGATEWHPTNQWFMRAMDLDKKALRDFAMTDIVEWRVK